MKIRAVYTFGCPRVLSPAAAARAESSLPEKIFRHARRGDVVPEIIAKHRLVMGREGREVREVYDHAGLIAFCDEADRIHFDPASWSHARESLRESLSNLGAVAPAAMEAHRIGRYQLAVYEEYRRDPRPRANGWSPVVALASARAARLAYRGPVRQVLPFLGFERARLVPGRGVEALIVVTRPQADGQAYGIVAFRSTRPEVHVFFDDWLRAVRDWQASEGEEQVEWYPGAPGSTHAEWLREVEEIELTLEEALRRICGALPVIVTGHGKGGAQALVWALRSIVEKRRGALAAARKLAAALGTEAPSPDAPSRDLSIRRSAVEQPEWRHPLSYAEVGARIRELRESRGVTQAELAALVECEQSHVSRIESGEHRVHLDTLLMVLGELDVSIAEFFHGGHGESLTPGDVRLIEKLAEMSEEDRAAVLHLVRFKRERERWEVD